MSAILDSKGRYIAEAQSSRVPRAEGPWLANAVASAQRDADAPLVALVSRHPDRLAFIAGKLKLLKVTA